MIVSRLFTLYATIIELFEIDLEISFNLLELLAVFRDMSFLITNVAPDQKYLVIFVIIRQLLLYLMKKSECLDRDLAGHGEKIISS